MHLTTTSVWGDGWARAEMSSCKPAKGPTLPTRDPAPNNFLAVVNVTAHHTQIISRRHELNGRPGGGALTLHPPSLGFTPALAIQASDGRPSMLGSTKLPGILVTGCTPAPTYITLPLGLFFRGVPKHGSMRTGMSHPPDSREGVSAKLRDMLHFANAAW